MGERSQGRGREGGREREGVRERVGERERERERKREREREIARAHERTSAQSKKKYQTNYKKCKENASCDFPTKSTVVWLVGRQAVRKVNGCRGGGGGGGDSHLSVRACRNHNDDETRAATATTANGVVGHTF